MFPGAISWPGESRDAVCHTHPRSKVSRKYLEIARKVNGDAVEDSRGFLDRVFGR